jgi:acetyl-CoA synthetase
LASPERIQFVAALPKTSSGKIIRRMLRKIASGAEDLGDSTALSNPEVIADIVRGYRNILEGRLEDVSGGGDGKK